VQSAGKHATGAIGARENADKENEGGDCLKETWLMGWKKISQSVSARERSRQSQEKFS